MPPPPLTYVFPPDETARRGWVRVLSAISVRARGLARRSREPAAESIHDLRLLIKRVRALLWFARPALAAPVAERARTRLRRAARLLAGQRDRAVMQATLEKLAKKASDDRDRAAVAHVFRSLVQDPAAGGAGEKSPRSTLRKAVGILCRAVDELKRRAADRAGWPSPGKRLAKAFHATRKAGKKARRTGKDTDFHAWRKKTKTLLYQLELTQAEPGGRMARVLKRVANLQDTLGAYHDCVVVEEQLRRMLPLPLAARRVADLLGKRKVHLRKRACPIARRLDASI